MTAKSYEIRVRGQIPPDELAEFDNLRTTVRPAETVLRGVVADQAALQGVLQRLLGLGLELTDIRRIADAPAISTLTVPLP